MKGCEIKMGFVFFVLFCFVFQFFLAELHSMWDLSSLTRHRTCVPPAMDVRTLNHWTREIPAFLF